MSAADDIDAVIVPRLVEAFPWHAEALRDLLATRERFPHALLLTGPSGIGKRQLAFALGRCLLCESPDPQGMACGVCPSCRYAAAFQHPDLLVIEPIEYDEEQNATRVEWIVVDRIRELTRWSQTTSHRRGAKVAIVAPAERMNAAAANALLKTLEEPPDGTYLLLASDQPGRLPATIVSRCRRVVVPTPSATVAAQWLATQGVPRPEIVLAQAAGAPLAALALNDSDYQAERAIWLNALGQPLRLSPAQLAARIDALPREQRRAQLAHVVDWLIAWCADLASVLAGQGPRRNPDQRTALTALAGKLAPVALFRYYRSLLNQRALLSHPLQPRLVAEALLIEYHGLFN